jgi:predicted metalloprotease with PDZ domain
MRRSRRSWFAFVLFLAASIQAVLAENPASVKYTVSFAGYRDHLLHIRCELPPGGAQQVVQLPVWNALYQVRDFAQYVNWLRATDAQGQTLRVEELDKSSWRVDGAGSGAVIEYEVFADDGGPYGAQINDQHAFLNLAEILTYPVAGRALPTQVRFKAAPPGWKFATSLQQTGEWFAAANYDALVDAPVEAGVFREADFDEGGARYRVVVDADPADYNLDHMVVDLRKIVAAATHWMNDRPYQSYVFLYHFPRGNSGGGGMEHAYSTAIDLNAQTMHDDPAAIDDVSAHEFFHLWNVKRIRPQSLEPIDYTKENYTTALWFSEGVTSTVEDIIQLRAGLMDERHFLRRLGQQIAALERRPAHLTQSAEDSSRDAWLEKYPYYFRPERSISYYNKGDLLGVMLDLQVRQNSHGRASLRDVFQWMNEHYAKQGKFFPDSEGVRVAAEAVGGGDLSEFFQMYVAGTDEIPWDEFLRTVGLRAVRSNTLVGDPGFVAARSFDSSPAVLEVESGGNAESAGLVAGDVILDLNDKPAASDFRSRLASLQPGDTITLRIRNRTGEHKLRWRVGSREEVEFRVEDMDNVTGEQRARRAAWLTGESQPSGEGHP